MTTEQGSFDATFRKDSEGRTIFYPLGMFAAGRTMADTAVEQDLKSYLNRILWISIIIFSAAWFFFGALGVIAALPFTVAWRYFGALRRIGNAPLSNERITLKDVLRKPAITKSKGALWISCIVGYAFMAAGVFISVDASTADDIAISISTIAFFGFIAAMSTYMLKIRNEIETAGDNAR